MKRFIKILAVTCVAALALAAMAAAGASAATFTASAAGKVKGVQTTNQVFTISSSSKVTCPKAHTTGEIKSPESPEQHVTVTYTECVATFFGINAGSVTINPATYNFTADGEVHVLNTITIHSNFLACDVVVTPQTVKSAGYTNNAALTDITVAANVSGIVSESTNGCPTSSTGTYTGSNTVEREGGGFIRWDK